MKKLVCESIQEYRRILEGAPAETVAPVETGKVVHPAKTLKNMLNMPYPDFVKALKTSASDPKFANVMNLGRKDGLPTDETVKVTFEDLPVNQLQPTQSQIGLKDSIGWVAQNLPESVAQVIAGNTSAMAENARILTANKKYILDGHHRWSQVFILNPAAKIPCVNLEIPGFKDPTQLLKIVQLAIAATYKTVPGSGADLATDIFDEGKMSEAQIKEFLPSVLNLEPAKGGRTMMEVCKEAYGKKYAKQLKAKGMKELSDADVINILTRHAMLLKKFKPKRFAAPERNVMPQPGDAAKAAGADTGGAAGVPKDFIKKMQSGQLNFKKPLIADQVPAEKK